MSSVRRKASENCLNRLVRFKVEGEMLLAVSTEVRQHDLIGIYAKSNNAASGSRGLLLSGIIFFWMKQRFTVDFQTIDHREEGLLSR